MIPSDSQQLESYVPIYDVVPAAWEDARPFIVEQLKKITISVNSREIGFFLDQELLTGKAFIPGFNIQLAGGSSQQFRSVLRMVVDFGALPNASVKSVPHEIMVDNNFTLVQMWACATDPLAFLSFPIPYCDPYVLANGVALTMDATNVNIATGINRTTFTRCFVVIEYMQEL